MGVAVFHRIGEPTEDRFTHSIEQIMDYDGQITFDGIYRSVFEHRAVLAWREPILFITGEQIGRKNFCNREQLEHLNWMGFRLGWHGWTHRKITELSDSEQWEELKRPDWVSPFYAYPHGEYDQRAIEKLKKGGYIGAYSTTQGEDSDFAIRREYI